MVGGWSRLAGPWRRGVIARSMSHARGKAPVRLFDVFGASLPLTMLGHTAEDEQTRYVPPACRYMSSELKQAASVSVPR
jgi:hypothetical protein